MNGAWSKRLRPTSRQRRLRTTSRQRNGLKSKFSPKASIPTIKRPSIKKKAPKADLQIFADSYLTLRASILEKAIIEPVSDKMMSEIILYFTEKAKNHDKEYRVRIMEVSGGYNVEYAFGKRGSVGARKYNLSNENGPISLPLAKSLMEDMIGKKRKKGYTTNKSGVPFS